MAQMNSPTRRNPQRTFSRPQNECHSTPWLQPTLNAIPAEKHLLVVHLCSSIPSLLDAERVAGTEAILTPELDQWVKWPGLNAAKGGGGGGELIWIYEYS